MGTFQINNDTLEFHIGFILDGVTTYRNLSKVLPQYSRQNVYRNPTLTAWSEEKVVRPGRETLEIEVHEHESFFCEYLWAKFISGCLKVNRKY